MKGRGTWRNVLRAVVAALSLVMVIAQPSAAQDEVEFAPLEVLSVVTRPDGRIAIEVAAPAELTGADLPASAFRVAQEGVDRPLSSQRLPNDELDIVLVIDVSGSMAGSAMESAKEAAISFLRQLPADAQVSLVSFGPEATLVQPFGATFQDVADSVAALEPAGETALYDGIDLAIDQFAIGRSSRRTVVVLSDGEDTVSLLAKDEAKAQVGSADLSLYAISLGNAQVDVLQELVASADGGLLSSADNPAGLIELYDRIGALLANQYRLIFTPADSVSSTGRVFVSQLGVDAASDFEFVPAAAIAADTAANDELSGEVALPLPEATAVVVTAPWASSDLARFLGVGALGLALLLVGLLLFNSGPAVRLAGAQVGEKARAFSATDSGEQVREKAEGIADRFLAKRDRGQLVGIALERAGFSLRPAEFVVLAFSSAVFVAALLFLAGGLIVAILGAVFVFFGLRAWLTSKGAKRSEEFTDQLGQTVQLLAGALRSGHALPQALEVVARESAPPTSDEFRRLVVELRLGRDLGDSLDGMKNRVQSDDFEWVVRAIDIHRQIGGNLAEVLDNIHSTIRDRSYIRRQFKSLSAEGRYSAYVLVSLPFIVAAALFVLSPGYVDTLVSDSRGQLLTVVALVNILLGSLWLKALLKVKF